MIKTLIPFILFFASTHVSAASSGSVDFSSGGVLLGTPYSLALQPGICLTQPLSCIISGVLNPSITAVDAPIGSIYMSNLTGVAYTKQDNGLSTNWSMLALTSATFSSIGPIDGNGTSANGLTASGSNLYAQSASGTVPGMVNTGGQTFAGTKTFTGNVFAANLTSSSPRKNFVGIELNGNDSTCAANDLSRPCATYAKAITLASSAAIGANNQWVLQFGVGTHLLGNNPKILPYISLNGSSNGVVGGVTGATPDTSLTYTGTLGLHATAWQATGGAVNFSNLALGDISFDTVSVGAPSGTVFITFTNVSSGVISVYGDNDSFGFSNFVAQNDGSFGGGFFTFNDESTMQTVTVNNQNSKDTNVSLASVNVLGSIIPTQSGTNNLVIELGPLLNYFGNPLDNATGNPALTFLQPSSLQFYTTDTSFTTAPFNGGPNDYASAITELAQAQVVAWRPRMFGSRGSPINISAAGGMNTNNTNISTSEVNQVAFVQGSAGAVTVTAATPIAIPTLPVAFGNQLLLIGSSSTNTLTFNSTAGKLELHGSMTLGLGDTLSLRNDGTAWREVSRSYGIVGSNAAMVKANSTESFFSVPNLAANSSGEQGTTGWTASGGTLTTTTTAADIGNGARSVTWTPSANAQTLVSTQTTLPPGYYGKKCTASMDYKGASANITFQVWDGASALGAGAVTLAAQATYVPISIGFVCPSSGTVGLKLSSTAASAVIKIDSAAIRYSFELDTPLIGYASGAGTVSATDTPFTAIQKLNGNIALDLPLSGGTMTGQLFGKNAGGTISAPQFAFTTPGGSGGMYYDGSVVGLTYNSNFFLTGNDTGVVMPGLVSVGAGSAGAPGLNINGEPSTGFYYISAGKLGFSGQGALKASFSNAGVESVTGNIIVSTAGKGLTVKTGANAKSGHATCSAGSVAVSNTSVTANSHVLLTIMTPGGVVTGAPWISSFTAASGFTISCSSASDTSVVGYDIIEEIP